VEDAVAERQDSIGIGAALAPTGWVCSWADGLRVVAPVARLECCNPSPFALLLYPVTGLEEVEPSVARSKRVVPWLVKPSTEQARPLDGEQVFLVPAKLEVSCAPLLLDDRTPSVWHCNKRRW
jgi:hypothetical protein